MILNMNMAPTEFQAILQSVRLGDATAIAQFVKTYEPFIRRTIRIRLERASMRAVADSVDVSQSVLGSLFIRLAVGQFEIHSEADLRKLLFTVANNKLKAIQRRELAEKRNRRLTVLLGDMDEIVDSRQTNPEETIGYQELLTLFEERLNPDERRMYQQRRQGVSWKAIAAHTQQDANSLRVSFFRAVRRVALELRIEEQEDEFTPADPS